MDETQKRKLVENSQNCTLEGSPTKIGGWRNSYATLSPQFGGFWHTSWETVERVLAGDRNFIASDVSFSSWRWLGVDAEVPKALKGYL